MTHKQKLEQLVGQLVTKPEQSTLRKLSLLVGETQNSSDGTITQDEWYWARDMVDSWNVAQANFNGFKHLLERGAKNYYKECIFDPQPTDDIPF